MHARRAGGHAGEAGQAAVDMLDDLGGRRPVVLQHVLDQVDAPARGIELVAEQHIGRAGRGAEAAMHAGAQDLVGFRDIRVGELGEGESWVCIGSHPRPHAAGIEHALGIEALLDPLGQCGKRRRPAARTRRSPRAPRPARGSASHARRSRRPRGAPAPRRHRRTRRARPRSGRPPNRRTSAPAPARRSCGELGAAARRRRDAPERPLVCAISALAAKGDDVADRLPERARARRLGRRRARRTACSSASSMRVRCATDGRKPLEPQRRDGAAPRSRSAGDAAGDPRRQMRRARHVAGRAHGAGHGLDRRRAVVEAAGSARVASVSGRGSTLTVTSVITASVPQEPAISLQRS